MKKIIILILLGLMGCASNLQRMNQGYILLDNGQKVYVQGLEMQIYSHPILIKGDYLIKEYQINGKIKEVHLYSDVESAWDMQYVKSN